MISHLRLSTALLAKFLLAIVLTQAITGLLVYLALRATDPQTWTLFAALGGVLGVLTTLFLADQASHGRREALSRAREDFAKERERLKVQAERNKHRAAQKAQRAAERQARRAQTGANLKTRATLAGLVGMGVFMMFTQFVTLGMVILTTGGGALAGYLYRARQEGGAAGPLPEPGRGRLRWMPVKALKPPEAPGP